MRAQRPGAPFSTPPCPHLVAQAGGELSHDFAHEFSIPDWQIRADLVAGKPVRVRVKPDKAGKFAFLCDNFCGSGHEEMNGSILVTA